MKMLKNRSAEFFESINGFCLSLQSVSIVIKDSITVEIINHNYNSKSIIILFCLSQAEYNTNHIRVVDWKLVDRTIITDNVGVTADECLVPLST